MPEKKQEKKAHFLVTGGAGFLGINLVRFLVNKGHKVTSLDTAEFTYQDVKDRIKVIEDDIRNERVVKLAMNNVDIVVHSAAALPLYSRKDIFTTNVEGTRLILQAALEKNIQRVIYVSSTAVYGIPDHHPITENAELVGVGPYGETKVLAEKVCERYRRKGMCVPIVRPKSFVGPERLGVFALLYEWAKDGKKFPILGKGENRYQFLDVEDLCQAIYLLAIKDCKIANDTFNIGAKDFKSLKEDFQAVLDYAGFGKNIVSLPATPVVLILRLIELLGISPLYQWIYETIAKDSFVSIDKAEKLLGFTPKYSNKQALIRNYQWYINNLNKFEKRSGFSHRVPWKQGVLKLAKLFF